LSNRPPRATNTVERLRATSRRMIEIAAAPLKSFCRNAYWYASWLSD
jgi:hypothetical protein